jgi:hypothetical protein
VRKRSIYRGFLIAAGLLAALVIILSQSFSVQAEHVAKPATEQTDTSKAQDAVIKAPAEAMPQSTVVRVNEQVPVSIIEILAEPQQVQRYIPQCDRIVNSFIKTIFRVIIAPNAP